MGGCFKRKGIHVYLWLIHVEFQQKTTKFCKAIILQLKKIFFKLSSRFLLNQITEPPSSCKTIPQDLIDNLCDILLNLSLIFQCYLQTMKPEVYIVFKKAWPLPAFLLLFYKIGVVISIYLEVKP